MNKEIPTLFVLLEEELKNNFILPMLGNEYTFSYINENFIKNKDKIKKYLLNRYVFCYPNESKTFLVNQDNRFVFGAYLYDLIHKTIKDIV